MPRYTHEEFCDDGEVGGGRILMNVIKRSHLTNIALFVVRKSKSVNIGASRFGLIKESLKSVMSARPYNVYINARQALNEDPTKYVPPPNRGVNTTRNMRGGRSGRRSNQRGRQYNRTMNIRGNYLDSDKRKRQESPESVPFDFRFQNPQIVATTMDREDLGLSWP